MPLPVSLKRVAEELDVPGEDWIVYLNRRTGELVGVAPEGIVDDTRGEAERMDGSPDFLALPGPFETHEWQIMMDFACSRDGAVAARLERALRGRGAFRTFKDAVAELELRDAWYEYRERAFARIAAEWLDAHEIPYVRDCGVEEAGG